MVIIVIALQLLTIAIQLHWISKPAVEAVVTKAAAKKAAAK